MNYNDSKTWKLYQAGQTVGVFQCESGLVQHWLKKIRPTNLWELSAAIALVRPGALQSGFADTYVSNRNNPANVEKFGNAIVDNILSNTNEILCIEENTRVSLADGSYKLIRDIKRGDIVKSFNLDSQTIENKHCSGCKKTYTGNGYKVTLQNGKSVILTGNHQLLTRKGMKKVEDLNPNYDLVASSTNLNVSNEEYSILEYFSNTTEIAYLLGYLVANGSLVNTTTICVGSLESTADFFLDYFKENFKNLSYQKFFNTRCWYIRILTKETANQKGCQTGTKQSYWNYCLNELDFRGVADKKKVPNCILSNSLEVQSKFFAGCFDGDGCITVRNDGNVNVTTIHYTSISKDLLDGLEQILMNLGILHTRSNLRLHIYSQNLFKNTIGKYLKLRSFKDGNFLSDGNRLGYVHLDEIDLSKINKNTRKKLYREKKSEVTFHIYSDQKIDTGDARYFKIRSIEVVNDCNFYDMSVDDNHTLIGNGIVLHNCYQEQLMLLGEKLAWPHLDEKTRKVKADDLRKAVGKKDQSKILAIGKEFSDGCRLNGVPEDMITKLFEVIKNCGRYLFNLSHSFSYAYVSYETAYLKAHHPLEFFETTLNYSFEKPDPEEEKNRLIQDAKKWQIKTVLPNFNLSNYDFVGDQNVLYYGLGHIKFFGESYRKMLETKPQVNSLLDLLRLGFTTHYGQAIRSNTFKALILAGAFDYLGYDRQQLSHLVTTLDILSPKELSHFVENASNKIEELPALLNYIAVEVSVKKRKNLLTSESQILEKNLKHTSKPGWIEEQERNYLGCIISASASEKFEKYSSHRCLDIMQFVPQQKIKGTLIAVIDKVNIRKVSKGKNVGQTWATIDVHDSTGQVEKLCVFNTTFEECSNAVVENNVVQIMFEHNDRGISAKSITTLETV